MPKHVAQFLYPLLLLLLGIEFHVPVLSPAATPTPFSPLSVSTLNLFSTLSFAKACYIAGTDSGTCYQVFETNAGVQTNVFDEGCNPTVESKAICFVVKYYPKCKQFVSRDWILLLPIILIKTKMLG